MEGSAAAGPAAATGDAAGGEQQQGQQDGQTQDAQQTPGVDLAGLESQMGEITQTLDGLREFMQNSAYEQAPEDTRPEDPAETDLSFIDPNSPTYDPQQAAGQLLQLLGQQNEQQLKDALAPLQEQVHEQKLQSEAAQLASEFPELEDPKTADALFQTAKSWGDSIGLPAEFAGNYGVLRAVYLMGRALEGHNAEGEQPDVPVATLEGAGGASPGGGSGQTAENIFGTQSRSPLPF